MLVYDLVDDADRAGLAATIAQVISTGLHSRVNVRVHTGTGLHWFELEISAHPAADGQVELLVVGRDMSAQQATEERLRHMATHDALTELPNRLLLSDRHPHGGRQCAPLGPGLRGGHRRPRRLQEGQRWARPHGRRRACCARPPTRLRKALRDSDTLARVGGDEFVAVLPGTASEAQIKLDHRPPAGDACSRPSRSKATRSTWAPRSASAIYPAACRGRSRGCWRMADAAMSRAKETGKAPLRRLQRARTAVRREHDISMEAAMFDAVREGEFLLYYQPIVDAGTRQIVGFETLMRWKHPTLGMVPPVRFIPIAETNGLINLLGAWALKAACVQLQQFEEVAGRELYVSVNISPRQFRNDKFLDVLDEALALSGMPGAKLVLEITEGTLMVDPAARRDHPAPRWPSAQARIAIDDFGTGYSSLAYLKRFPISVLEDRPRLHQGPAGVAPRTRPSATWCSTWRAT